MKLLAPFLCLFLFSKNIYSQQTGRLESEFKIAIPSDEEETLWNFLIKNYGAETIKKLDTNFVSSISVEKFTDIYFDDQNITLKKNNVGLRYRKRYIKDTLSKTLIQVKLPDTDSTGVARREIKFKPYDEKKKSDRKALHPFWKYIKPKNRDEINFHLSKYGVTGNELDLSVKVNQLRRRVYISKENESIMTITLDHVQSAYFPYPFYVEMELEINEIRFTNATAEERKELEMLNSKVKKDILSEFKNIKQDQTPKYNKMYDLLQHNWVYQVYDKMLYIILGIICSYAGLLFWKDRFKA